MTRSFQRMNDLLPGANEPSLLPLDTRIKVGILGLILGIIALSLSIGEATYQWRQEVLRRAAERREVSAVV